MSSTIRSLSAIDALFEPGGNATISAQDHLDAFASYHLYIGSYSFDGGTPTTFADPNEWTKILGATTEAQLDAAAWSNSVANRLVNAAPVTRQVDVQAHVTFDPASNNVAIGLAISVDGAFQELSHVHQFHGGGAGNDLTLSTGWSGLLAVGARIELYAVNHTDTSVVTAVHGAMIATSGIA